jgi:methionyl-tRNA synthetase
MEIAVMTSSPNQYQKLLQPSQHVEFLAGTDEHRLKIQKAADAKGLAPNVFCSQLSDQFCVCLEMLLAMSATNFSTASGKQSTDRPLTVHAYYTTEPS